VQLIFHQDPYQTQPKRFGRIDIKLIWQSNAVVAYCQTDLATLRCSNTDLPYN
jgi:hypothetical protein